MSRIRWEMCYSPLAHDLVAATIPEPCPEPWRAFCFESCTRTQPRSKDMCVLRGVDYSGAAVCSVWICFPDLEVVPPRLCSAFLMHVHVQPGDRGRGIGLLLLEEAKRAAASHGCASVLAATDNLSLKERFYGKAGFEGTADPCLVSVDVQSHVVPVPLSAGWMGMWRTHSLTAGDLATLQSISRFPHIRVRGRASTTVAGELVEEEFCEALSKGRAKLDFFKTACGTVVVWQDCLASGGTMRIIAPVL